MGRTYLNPAIIDAGGLKSRQQVLDGLNLEAIFKEGGAERGFHGEISGCADDVGIEIEESTSSGVLRPQPDLRELAGVQRRPRFLDAPS